MRGLRSRRGSEIVPAETTLGKGRAGERATEEYAQVFLYRVPKGNHDAFAEVEGKLAAIFRKCGVVRSEFYVLGDARIFRGFQDLRGILTATPEEEVWAELDVYRNKADSVQVIAKIGQDPAAGPLFGKVLQLATPGTPCAQGNAERVRL